ASRCFARTPEDLGLFKTANNDIFKNHQSLRFLYKCTIAHAKQPLIINNRQRYLVAHDDFTKKTQIVGKPPSLNEDSLLTALACIEDLDKALDFKQSKLTSGGSSNELVQLKALLAMLDKQFNEIPPGEITVLLQPQRKEKDIKELFDKSSWSLRLFRKDQTKPEAELVHFE
ncbi:MAG: hypothetical protein VB980_03935, partial [Opitutales bacterium]